MWCSYPQPPAPALQPNCPLPKVLRDPGLSISSSVTETARRQQRACDCPSCPLGWAPRALTQRETKSWSPGRHGATPVPPRPRLQASPLWGGLPGSALTRQPPGTVKWSCGAAGVLSRCPLTQGGRRGPPTEPPASSGLSTDENFPRTLLLQDDTLVLSSLLFLTQDKVQKLRGKARAWKRLQGSGRVRPSCKASPAPHQAWPPASAVCLPQAAAKPRTCWSDEAGARLRGRLTTSSGPQMPWQCVERATSPLASPSGPGHPDGPRQDQQARAAGRTSRTRTKSHRENLQEIFPSSRSEGFTRKRPETRSKPPPKTEAGSAFLCVMWTQHRRGGPSPVCLFLEDLASMPGTWRR